MTNRTFKDDRKACFKYQNKKYTKYIIFQYILTIIGIFLYCDNKKVG